MAKKQAAKPAGKAAKSSPKKQMTKAAVLQELAEKTELKRQQVAAVFDTLFEIIKRELSKKGSGVFTVPNGLLRLTRKMKKPTKERQGRNPTTGAPMTIAAKPGGPVIRPRALKTLKAVAEL